MPVAIRKRSWEEHVTHASGLQYSYDDLDLVCCHGVDSEGPWMGAEASKQGRRTRCASMPEGCHQLPTEDQAQTLVLTATVVIDDTKSEQLKIIDSNVPLDMQEESVHGPHELPDVDIPQRASESDHLQSPDIGNSRELLCNLKSGLSIANVSCVADSSSHCEKTVNGKGEVGTESSQSCRICNDDNVFKSPHISCEPQQCISISSNNGPPLSESAGEYPGKPPNNQETKESHTEGYSRSPEISEAKLNQSSAADLEPQTDLPHVEEETISISSQADAKLTLPVGVLHSSVNMMENGDVVSQADKAVKPVVTLMLEEVCDEEVTESRSADSASKLDGLNGPETLSESTGLKHHSRDIRGGEKDNHDCTGVLDQADGCEISYQTLLEQHNVEMTAMNKPQGEESAKAECSGMATEVRHGPIPSSAICFKGQCCSLTASSSMSSEKLDTGYSDRNHMQTNITQCEDQDVETTTTVSQPTENTHESSKELACCEDQTIAKQLENSCLKLDTILEVNHVNPDDTTVMDPQENSNFTQNPDVRHSHMSDEHAATEQHIEKLPPCSAEMYDELSPGGLHGNQEGSGCYSSESPASEVADGQREHHRPAAAASSMEETDEATTTAIYSKTQFASPIVDGANEPGDQKEDNVVKVRMRKRDHARLDSMVLLLMKLDQLDQEIENALSATSSMDSTPTLHRRQLLEFELGSGQAASQNPPHSVIPSASTSGPTPTTGAKHRSGVSQTLYIISICIRTKQVRGDTLFSNQNINNMIG